MTKFICQNCQATHDEELLNEVKDIHERVAPGEPMPAGECPDCGAVCHEDERPVYVVRVRRTWREEFTLEVSAKNKVEARNRVRVMIADDDEEIPAFEGENMPNGAEHTLLDIEKKLT